MINCGIYKITAPSGKSYIGSSNWISKRLWTHRSKLHSGGHENRRLQNAYNKYGELKEEVLLACREKDLIFYEQLCIDNYKPAYNQSLIAERNDWGPEARAKIGAAHKGRKHSVEHRAKISAAGKGRVWSAASIAKISATKMGHAVSSATRAKLRVAHTGKKLTLEHRAKMSASGKKRWAKKKELERCDML